MLFWTPIECILTQYLNYKFGDTVKHLCYSLVGNILGYVQIVLGSKAFKVLFGL